MAIIAGTQAPYTSGPGAGTGSGVGAGSSVSSGPGLGLPRMLSLVQMRLGLETQRSLLRLVQIEISPLGRLAASPLLL